MFKLSKHRAIFLNLSLLFALFGTPHVSAALEVGDKAPNFTLPSTNGVDISLSDFRGKKWVFLEFYAAAFVPTWAANLTARKADFKRFEALNVQILAVSADNPFSQQTFAESLKLPYPLLSDFVERKVIRAYGILNEKIMTAVRTFFLIDQQGVIRKKWVLDNPSTTVVYSDTILRDIENVLGKRWTGSKGGGRRRKWFIERGRES
jgi:mycoredoxin-dependent peroxiredoxin